jgi:hypothetical protein
MQKSLEPLDYLYWSNNATNYNNPNIAFKWTIKTLELKGLSQLKDNFKPREQTGNKNQ